MPLTFICEECAKRYFFQKYILNDGRKLCALCDNNIRFAQRKKETERQRSQKQSERRKINEQKADESLRKQLELEKEKRKRKEQQTKENTQTKTHDKAEPEDIPRQKIIISLEQEAASASRQFDKVLYVFADVKHIRAIEWLSGKKRVVLNKEREIRRTHKGGYSQEKFQKFVDMKKKKTAEWVEEHLVHPGVLRGPYDRVIIDTNNPEWKEAIKSVLRI